MSKLLIVGMFTDEIQLVDSVVNIPVTWCDSMGINRIGTKVQKGINRDGFVSEFDYDTATCNNFRKEGKKIVFIIGDSFVEGVAASGRDSTIVSYLKREMSDCAIYNFGVGGTDPLNYELILKQYVPLLKPDVVLMLVSYNDQMSEDRQPTPFIPLYFQANYMKRGGHFVDSRQPCPDSSCYYIQFTRADSLYNFLLNVYSYKRLPYSFLQKAMKNSALITGILRLGYGLPYYKYYCPLINWKQSFAYKHLIQSKLVSEKNGAAFRMIYVPGRDTTYQTLHDYGSIPDGIFHELKNITTFPTGYTKRDYISRDNPHLNDTGNRKFAKVCLDVIRKHTSTGLMR